MLKGLYCSKLERQVSMEECLHCSKTNLKCDIFPEFIEFLKSRYDEEYIPSISPTRLLGCARKAYLEKEIDYTVGIETLYYSFRGSLLHLLFEKFKTEDCLIEKKFEREWKGVKIVGIPDKIDVHRKTLWEFKTVATVADDFSLKWNNPRVRDQIQANFYKWLVEPVIPIENLVIVYVGSDCSRKYQVKVRAIEKDKSLALAFQKAEILSKIWDKPLEQVKAEGKLPKMESGWECRYCNVEAECKKLKETI